MPDLEGTDPGLFRVPALKTRHQPASLVPQQALLVERGRALPAPAPRVQEEEPLAILYTSGTMGKPQGVVLTHATLASQAVRLVQAWAWSADDRILNVLPLHHVHGVVNVVTCALWSGAACELAPRFDAAAVWQRLLAGGLTLFMAVPTIYTRLIAEWERGGPAERARMSEAARGLRLMGSGSAALPASPR